MLPPRAFTDPAVLDWELETMFRGWVCVGHASLVAEPGSYLMREIGTDSVVVMGAEDGRPRAFLNVCRHRGSRLIEDFEGSVRRRVQCPYHGWSYGLDGELKAAPHMDGVEDFDPSCWGLIPVRVATVGGLVLVDLERRRPRRRLPSGRARRPPGALPGRRPASRRPDLLRGRAPTGRRSPRTTASACTAPASIRSSTGSATT